ncbi:MAG TPA: acyltransferase [Candidatus Cybelea sp.]|nr:acyltransferase [Candidatus Cybelea sp.]
MRLVQLDSLRGLAACLVVYCHATNLLPGVYDHPQNLWWLTETPLVLLREGHGAVIFFFVLSGYVLTLPFLKGPVSAPAFIFRRVCRIWIPYAAAMVVAVCCALYFHPDTVPALSHWANQPISFPSLRLILDHLLLVGVFANQTYNRVVWSLVYEMRISLIFPILVLLLRLGAWWRVLGAAAGLSVAELVVERWPCWSGSEDVPMTLHYAGLFVLGMVLARETPKLRECYSRISTWTKACLWLLAVACFGHDTWLFPNSRLQHVPLYRDGLTAVGVALIIVFALSPSRFSSWLNGRIPVFLGKISYSMYLYHAVILLSLAHLFYPRVPLSLVWLGTGVLTIAAAALSYQVIELPSIRLGKCVGLERKLQGTPSVELSASREQGSAVG